MLEGIRNAVILYNPTAGRLRRLRVRLLREAQEVLKRAGITAELEPTARAGSAAEQARRAVQQGRQLVIVSGGDGTLNEAVNGLAGSQVPLALLPSGTANVVAKELELPWDIPRVARLLPQCVPRRIALGRATAEDGPAGGRYFIAMGGAGFDAKMVRSVSEDLKRRTGILAYWLAGASLYGLHDFTFFRVKTREREAQGSTVVIGRTKHYGGPSRITTEANLFEDLFEVCVLPTRSSFSALVALVTAMRGKLHGTRHAEFWKSAEVRCEPMGSEPIYAQVDGEVVGRLPVEFRIVPDALTLLVPPQIAARLDAERQTA